MNTDELKDYYKRLIYGDIRKINGDELKDYYNGPTTIYRAANEAMYFTKIKKQISKNTINARISYCAYFCEDISTSAIIYTDMTNNKICNRHDLESFSSFRPISVNRGLDDFKGDKTMVTDRILNKLKETGKLQAQNVFNRYVVPIATSRVKYHFGREYYISSEIYLSYDNDIINFFKKYDKKFNNHVVFKDGKMTDVNAYIALIPYDNHTFIYVATKNYVPFFLENKMGNNSNNNNSNNSYVYIYIFGRRMNKIASKFQYCIDHVFSAKDKGDCLYVVNSYTNDRDGGGRDITYYDISRQHRADNTVFFSSGELEKIFNHIDNFLKNKNFYDEHDLLFKTGILLYGEPGTGKSTLANVISTKYHRSIVSINMTNINNINLSEVSGLITRDTYDDYIVLLEDIDTAFNNLDRSEDKDSSESNKVINSLLQFLDSNTSPTNVIFIATTNYVDRLDSALVRSGRFDLKVEIKGLNDNDAISMGKSFGLSENQAKNAISKYHQDKPDKDTINQSSIQNYFLEEKKNAI